jgi:hypothetical protein
MGELSPGQKVYLGGDTRELVELMWLVTVPLQQVSLLLIFEQHRIESVYVLACGNVYKCC